MKTLKIPGIVAFHVLIPSSRRTDILLPMTRAGEYELTSSSTRQVKYIGYGKDTFWMGEINANIEFVIFVQNKQAKKEANKTKSKTKNKPFPKSKKKEKK